MAKTTAPIKKSTKKKTPRGHYDGIILCGLFVLLGILMAYSFGESHGLTRGREKADAYYKQYHSLECSDEYRKGFDACKEIYKDDFKKGLDAAYDDNICELKCLLGIAGKDKVK